MCYDCSSNRMVVQNETEMPIDSLTTLQSAFSATFVRPGMKINKETNAVCNVAALKVYGMINIAVITVLWRKLIGSGCVHEVKYCG